MAFKVRSLLALVIVLVAIVPSITISLLLLDEQYKANDASMQRSLNRALDNTIQDLDFKFSIFSTNFKLFSRERYLIQALDSFLFSSHAFTSMKDFVEQTTLVSSIYLLDTDLQIVEEYQGSIIGLEESELLTRMQAAIDEDDVKDGRQLLFQFKDQRMTSGAEGEQKLSDYGVAVLMPLYLHVLQEGVSREAEGYILAVLPFDAIYKVISAHLQEGEAVEIVQGQVPIAAHPKAKKLRQELDHQMAIKSLKIGANVTENTLEYAIFLHVRKSARMAEMAQAQQTLSSSIIIAIILAMVIAFLLARLIGQPFKILSSVLEQYKAGNYIAPTLRFKFLEFEQVRQLIAGMGDTITRQLTSLKDKNRELQHLSELKDDYLSKLTALNEQLEQRVDEKTAELRNSLSREELSRQFMQSLLKLSIELQQCENNVAVIELSLQLMSDLFPNVKLALYFAPSRYQPAHFSSEGMTLTVQTQLRDELETYSDSRLAQLPKTINLHDAHCYLFHLGSVSNQFLGALVVQSDTLENEQQNNFRLFVKQISAIVETRLLTEELGVIARTDELTGLPNRKAFEEAFDNYASIFERYSDRHFGLFVVDANGLKLANDKYGHQAGDSLLKALAALLSKICRKSDSVYRLGGDEFALLVQKGTLEGCQLLTDRLVQEQGRHSVTLTLDGDKIEYLISFSTGFASTEEYPPNRLFKLADERMYDQKQTHYKMQRLGKTSNAASDSEIDPKNER
ncbi:GGDEF domain-containing protein [Corallincola luteus]|uniref:diguanylate cyclase n=1 Tax=Corallincola luteus TaxID=1775177 RepID=A0ABY2AQ87_9GAMM|nr:GGDEF domain-containing protein [Corallincola luteus]TCI04748.1 GGDEF domain-containing protein [Corallincola luteus]